MSKLHLFRIRFNGGSVELVEACSRAEAIAKALALHKGVCPYCRRTRKRGHAGDCAFVAAKELIEH
jgi:hypothetical protein